MRVTSSEVSRCLTISEKHRPFYVNFSVLRLSTIRHTVCSHEKRPAHTLCGPHSVRLSPYPTTLHVLLRHILRGVDLEDAIAPTVTMVNDGRTTGLLVHEQEEVMSDQLHLIQRLIDGHRLRDMQLATDDNRSVAYLDLDGNSPGPNSAADSIGLGCYSALRPAPRLPESARRRQDRPGPDRCSHDDDPCDDHGCDADGGSACREPCPKR